MVWHICLKGLWISIIWTAPRENQHNGLRNVSIQISLRGFGSIRYAETINLVFSWNGSNILPFFIFEIFGMTRQGIEPLFSRSRDRRSDLISAQHPSTRHWSFDPHVTAWVYIWCSIIPVYLIRLWWVIHLSFVASPAVNFWLIDWLIYWLID